MFRCRRTQATATVSPSGAKKHANAVQPSLSDNLRASWPDLAEKMSEPLPGCLDGGPRIAQNQRPSAENASRATKPTPAIGPDSRRPVRPSYRYHGPG